MLGFYWYYKDVLQWKEQTLTKNETFEKKKFPKLFFKIIFLRGLLECQKLNILSDLHNTWNGADCVPYLQIVKRFCFDIFIKAIELLKALFYQILFEKKKKKNFL